MPKKKDLTIKQKMFVAEYIKNKGNGAQAVLKSYNTTDLDTAKSMAAENLAKPYLRQKIEEALISLDLTPEYTLKGFKNQAEYGEDGMTKIRALENIADIQDLYPKHNTNSLEIGDGKLKISWQQ
jgi:phage terminase small subunit